MIAERMRGALQMIADMNPASIEHACEMVKIAKEALEQQPSSARWIAVTGAGQVKVGDKLRFKIGDKEYSERAKQILNSGTEKEEIIYHIRENFYFITSMVASGFSNHKCVEVLKKSAT
jgi:hypothetical protein